MNPKTFKASEIDIDNTGELIEDFHLNPEAGQTIQ